MKMRTKKVIHIDIFTIFMLLSCIVAMFYFIPFMSNFLSPFSMFGILCILFL